MPVVRLMSTIPPWRFAAAPMVARAVNLSVPAPAGVLGDACSAVACGLVAVGVLVRPAIKPALALSILLGLFFWIAEGAGGIFTGQGTDPSTGLLLILLAACYWPWRGASVGVPAVPDDGRSIRLPYGN